MMLIRVGFIFTNHLSLPCVRSFVLHGNGSVTWLVNEYVRVNVVCSVLWKVKICRMGRAEARERKGEICSLDSICSFQISTAADDNISEFVFLSS